jgi:GNAT superfamily N-acetyltransferase
MAASECKRAGIASGTPCPAGFVLVEPLQGDSSVAEARRLQVAAPCRRRGLGRQLMARVERHCREHGGFTKIVLSTITLHEKALRLYEACGFERRGPEKVHGTVRVVRFEKAL